MRKVASGLVFGVAIVMTLPAIVFAQASGIAGVVKDTTGP